MFMDLEKGATMLNRARTMRAMGTRQHGPILLAIPIDTSQQPEVFLCRLNGRVHRIRRWSADEWDRTSEADRPARPLVGDRGGRLIIEPVDKI